jgi:peptidoglycan hydrolase-like protein with peptidoglycan-binding domain
MRRLLLTGFAVLALWLAPAAAARVDPQVAGLQVALRAFGVYTGPIDAIAGPATKRGVTRFQRRVGLPADGKVGPATRRAFGPLGGPLFGKRTLRRGLFGWDVSVLQFLLARRGELVPVSGYFDARTERAVRIFQQARKLAADGVAGSRTLAAFRRPAPTAVKPVLVSATSTTPATQVRSLLDYWAGKYGVDGSSCGRSRGWSPATRPTSRRRPEPGA